MKAVDIRLGYRRNWKQISLFLLFLLTVHQLHAQIPHGISRPLVEGAEKASSLGSAVDYFVEMPSLDTDSARYIDDLPGNRVGGLRFAHTFFTNLSPENSGITFHTEDGSRIWKVGIRSNGAFSLNVLFSQYELPKGASVFLYNPDRSVVLGPFTCENRPNGGEFPVAPVQGDELIVEYREPSEASFNGKLRITEVNHDYRGLFRSSPTFDPTDLPCIPDASCNPALETIARSTCLLIINGSLYCTGTLLNNTALDGKPYVLTASHCLNNNSSYGNRIIAFLNYESPRCDNRIRGSEEFSVSGSVCRALNNEVDFALVELLESPPKEYRPYLAGWSLQTKTNDDKPFTSIHHPNGDVRKYAVEEDSLPMMDWPSAKDSIKAGNHRYVEHWEVGHTWGGSSGCGLFDRNLRLRGGLTGGSSGGYLGCEAYNEGDFFFRFDRAWNQSPDVSKQLKHWLDPITPDSLPTSTLTLDGLDPFMDNPAKRISNLQKTDLLSKVYLNGGWGSPFGHSKQKTTLFAERFSRTDSTLVYGTYLVVAKGTNNSDKPVYVVIYAGGETPGSILGKALINPNYPDYVPRSESFVNKTKTYFSNKENYVRFNKPVRVGTDFFIGFEIKYPITSVEDTFHVFAALRTEPLNTSYFKRGVRWQAYSSHPTNPMNTSMWIEPVVAKDTSHTPIDTSSFISVVRPTVAWSAAESKVIIAFPFQWIGTTTVEFFDLAGRVVKKTVLEPPLGFVYMSDETPKLLLIRMNNGKTVATQKVMIGFE